MQTDVDTRCVYINQRCAELIGLSISDTLLSGLERVIHADDRRMVKRAWVGFISRKGDFAVECRIPKPDGKVIWVSGKAVELFSRSGEHIGYLGTVEDISDRKEAEHKLTELLDLQNKIHSQVPGVVYQYKVFADGRACFPFSSEGIRDIYHVTPDEVREDAVRVFEMLHPDDIDAVVESIQHSMDTLERWQCEYRVRYEDGTVRWLLGNSVPQREVDGSTIWHGFITDITESKQAQQMIADQREQLHVTLASIADAVIATDTDGNIEFLNPVAQEITGWSSEKVLGRSICEMLSLFDERTDTETENPILRCVRDGISIEPGDSISLLSLTGQKVGVEMKASPIKDRLGVVRGGVLVFRDVTSQRKLANENAYRASHDPLTGVLNRTEFERILENRFATEKPENQELAILYLDLDQFKLVNDTCGHAAGDRVLQEATAIISNCITDDDILARIGGDEFAILLSCASRSYADFVGQSICDQVGSHRFWYGDHKFRVGVSIGLVFPSEYHGRIGDLLNSADLACYRAKQEGRGRVIVSSDSRSDLHSRKGQVECVAQIEDALESDRFVLYAQMLVPASGRTEKPSCEILLRMIDRDGRTMMPGSFLPVAEQYHLIKRIDRMVFEKVLAFMNCNRLALADFSRIGINLSGESMGDPEFHHFVERTLQDQPQAAAKICFEITETAVISNVDAAVAFMDRLRKLNVEFALDDFGTGISSFGYLKDLPVDCVKIDGHFIRNVATDEVDYATVKCIIQLAKAMGKQTVAECIETAECKRVVEEIGVDLLQGYYLHRPEPLEDLFQINQLRAA